MNHEAQLNNIMNPDTDSSEESIGQANKVEENLVQEKRMNQNSNHTRVMACGHR